MTSCRAKEVGYWTLLRVDGKDAESSMSEEDVKMFRGFGVEFFLTLDSDGTAVIVLDEPVKGTWADGKIMAEGDAPEIDWSLYGGDPVGGEEPGGQKVKQVQHFLSRKPQQEFSD